MSLYIIGIGPGDHGYLTAQAMAAIDRCTHVIGYGYYLELLGSRIAGKNIHAYALGEERDRCRHALELAAAHQDQEQAVALVCSGDPGIFAMAALVMEIRHRHGPKTDVHVVPGISAMQALAARTGAPLGHDFAVISLSDLLTPAEVILQRLRAAAQADFVMVLYNPSSKTRQALIHRCKEIALQYKPPQTPVITGRQVSRPQEHIERLTLAEFDPGRVDMFTLVIIGNRHSRMTEEGVYTPRGYRFD